MSKFLPDDLVLAWEELALSVATLPTQDVPWMIACLSSYSLVAHVVVRRRGGAVAAVAPLVQRGSTLEIAGGSELSEPGDLLAEDEESLATLAGELIATKRPIVLPRVPHDSPTVEALRKAAKGRARIKVSEAAGNPTIPLDERWIEPGGGMSSSRRSALRRSRRKADKLGSVSFEFLEPTPDEVDGLLKQAFAVESRSWKGGAGTAVSMVPKMKEFFRSYATELASRKELRVDFMRVDEMPVAMQLGARWHDRHWLFKIGYDADYSPASPGQLLLAESVAEAARGGLRSYELLGSRDSWTDAWSRDVQACSSVTILPYNFHSLAALTAARAGGAVKRVEKLVRRLKAATSGRARRCYVTGEDLESALVAEEHFAAAGFATTVGYWNRAGEPAADVAAAATAAASALRPGSEVSVKLPGLGGDGPLLEEVFASCRANDLTFHIDALDFESAAATQRAAIRLCEQDPAAVGCTLPSRWSHSLADAEALASEPVRVRIVKGEVEGGDGNDVDPVANFVAIAEALAGGRCHVEVATQDARVARESLRALVAAETSCELQVLAGMKSKRAIAEARSLDVPVRVYVPYGNGRLPYRLRDIRRKPWLAATFLRDFLAGKPRRSPAS